MYITVEIKDHDFRDAIARAVSDELEKKGLLHFIRSEIRTQFRPLNSRFKSMESKLTQLKIKVDRYSK